MTDFNPAAYGPLVAELITAEFLPALRMCNPNLAAKPKLQTLTIEALFPTRARDPDMARCCIAALWLRHDFLDEAHSIVQHIGSLSASFWHGIIHWRERDYPNAKHWLLHVRNHPVFQSLLIEAAEALPELTTGLTFEHFRPDTNLASFLTEPGWEPADFVDLCASNTGTETIINEYCRLTQKLEWQLLFDWCWQHAR